MYYLYAMCAPAGLHLHGRGRTSGRTGMATGTAWVGNGEHRRMPAVRPRSPRADFAYEAVHNTE